MHNPHTTTRFGELPQIPILCLIHTIPHSYAPGTDKILRLDDASWWLWWGHKRIGSIRTRFGSQFKLVCYNGAHDAPPHCLTAAAGKWQCGCIMNWDGTASAYRRLEALSVKWLLAGQDDAVDVHYELSRTAAASARALPKFVV
jgi:hypothetical protein